MTKHLLFPLVLALTAFVCDKALSGEQKPAATAIYPKGVPDYAEA